MKTIKCFVLLAAAAVSAAAVVKELSMPKGQRTWHGNVLGVPYDFRVPSFERFKDSMWNPHDQRLFTPRPFGVGWSVNFARLFHKTQEASEMWPDERE